MNSPRQLLALALEVPASQGILRTGLVTRLASLGALLILELLGLSLWLDTEALNGRGGFIGGIGDFGPYVVRSFVISVTVFLALGFFKARSTLRRISDPLTGEPLGWGFLAPHCGAMIAFAVLSALLFGGARGGFGNLVASTWLAAGALGIVTALFAFIPVRIVKELLRNTGSAWVYATAAGVLTPVFTIASDRLWKPATAVTFVLVKWLLYPFVSQTVADPARALIGGPKFAVQIAPGCSGLEGMGLMLVFGALWLWFFRSEYRFPRALLLIPLGMGLMFLLNSVRIAALVLIGNAGARSVAVGGFHSQAGWIAFNTVALALACLAHRVPWVSSGRRLVAVAEPRSENSLPAYLAPFLAILTAGMVSTATAGTFEWLYPLRFVAAAGTLLVFRRAYTSLNWRFGWVAPAVGGLVFLLWIGLDRIAGAHAPSGIAAGLAALPVPARIGWLTFRTLAAVVTVPIAEELAFRGFLLRRLISADFESVSLQRWTLVAVLGSSVAFGLMHGDRWIAGTAAGILYAGAQKWQGRIGDAIVAHGVTNALIAAWVLWGGHWSLW